MWNTFLIAIVWNGSHFPVLKAFFSILLLILWQHFIKWLTVCFSLMHRHPAEDRRTTHLLKVLQHLHVSTSHDASTAHGLHLVWWWGRGDGLGHFCVLPVTQHYTHTHTCIHTCTHTHTHTHTHTSKQIYRHMKTPIDILPVLLATPSERER